MQRSSNNSESGSYKLLPSVEIPVVAATAEPVIDGSNGDAVAEAREPRDWQSRGVALLETNIAQALTISAILLNAGVMGLETDLPELMPWELVENLFLCFFATELIARLASYGARGYFRWKGNNDFFWNVFDFVIVVLGCTNFLFETCAGGRASSMGKNATLFRMVRLLRLLRVLRIIRIVRFLKQLYLLAYGFIEGTMAVFWVTILASFMLYICSVILVRTYGHGSYEDEDESLIFETRFGTIPRCMFALFELISAPDLQPYRQIMFHNPPLVFFLIIFIILGSFGINGLLVALINESILEKNQARIEADRIDREWKRKLMQQQCRALFDELDVNQNRVLPRSELMKCKGQIAKLFEVAGVNFQRNDLDQMFYIMDMNDTGIIEKDEFVSGVVELCDQIRPMSIMELNYQVSKCAGKIEQCDMKLEDLSKTMERYDAKIDHLGTSLRTGGGGSNSTACPSKSTRPEVAAAEELVELLRAAGLQGEELRASAKESADRLKAQRVWRSSGSGSSLTALSPPLYSPATSSPEAPLIIPSSPGLAEDQTSLRRLLEEYSRLLAEVHTHISFILKGSSAGQSGSGEAPGKGPDELALHALGKRLFGLQRSTTDVLERLLAPSGGQAAKPEPVPKADVGWSSERNERNSEDQRVWSW